VEGFSERGGGLLSPRGAVAQKRQVYENELELELIQPHMAQKPVLRGEVGCACVAREVSVERGCMGERGCARQDKSLFFSKVKDMFC